ncbi:hypothetical protein [Bradyrhizobium jicamae]|nr:hypothetical protein [Bradyrhizobium jicamae]
MKAALTPRPTGEPSLPDEPMIAHTFHHATALAAHELKLKRID